MKVKKLEWELSQNQEIMKATPFCDYNLVEYSITKMVSSKLHEKESFCVSAYIFTLEELYNEPLEITANTLSEATEKAQIHFNEFVSYLLKECIEDSSSISDSSQIE